MSKPPLFVVELPDVRRIEGPLLFVDGARGVTWGEIVAIVGSDGASRRGQVVEVHGDRAVVQVLGPTRGLGLGGTRVRRSGRPAQIGVGPDLLGRVLDGSGRPKDGLPPPLHEALVDIGGQPLNPVARDHPTEFIQTGISAIDGLNTLVRGQKLPVFSGFGLPAEQLAVHIATRATVRDGADFAVVFGAMGITHREESSFRRALAEGGALSRTAVFLNLANDPTLERLLVPRMVLSLAEYLAFERDMHVLVILTDMTHYCEALREVATAREEVPGRRGYPGYMYTDLAGIYERAGRVRGRPGSVTQLVLLSMPDDDITHPIPDLTGYITEGQIVLDRGLHRRGVDPPIAVLPSLSRLMNAGIGEGRTREDHRAVADQLYAHYARGEDLRRMVAIVGEAALSEQDQQYLAFAEAFEQEFVHQAGRSRDIEQTLSVAWKLLSVFPDGALKRIPRALVERYRSGPE